MAQDTTHTIRKYDPSTGKSQIVEYTQKQTTYEWKRIASQHGVGRYKVISGKPPRAQADFVITEQDGSQENLDFKQDKSDMNDLALIESVKTIIGLKMEQISAVLESIQHEQKLQTKKINAALTDLAQLLISETEIPDNKQTSGSSDSGGGGLEDFIGMMGGIKGENGEQMDLAGLAKLFGNNKAKEAPTQ